MTTFFQDQGVAIMTALTIFGLTLIIGALLRPTFETVGRWLQDRLTGLFSGFERAYRQHLLEIYRMVDLRGRKAKDEENLELEQVYVSLRAERLRAGGKSPETLDIGQAMAGKQRLVIIGKPGSGKTTLLHYLLLTYTRRLTQPRLKLKEQRLPLYARLSQLKAALPEATQAGLPHYLTQTYADLKPPPGFFESALKAGRCLVLLDGMDEVANAADRLKMARWIEQQVSYYPKNRFIVTSRPAGYDEAKLAAGFTRLDVRDFSQADIEQFCHNWCKAAEIARHEGRLTPHARGQAEASARNLITAISQNKNVRALANNPLQLSIIALVHRSGATLPKRRVELYAECVDVLLGKWDRAKGLAGRLTEKEKRAVLQPLALYMHQQEARDLAEKSLKEQLAQYLPRVGGRPEEVDQFLQEVKERSGLLQEEGLTRYAFSHLTFQEYLVACQLVESGQEGLLLAQAGNKWWQEVILLYTGLKDATPLVRALLAQATTADHQALWLAGRCLMDARDIDPAARRETVSRLEAAFDQATGRPLLEAGLVLAELSQEQALTRFLRVVGGPNEARRNAALWALEQMVNDENELLRQQYRQQLALALNDTTLTDAAIRTLQGFSWQNDKNWRNQIGLWLKAQRSKLDWLGRLVTEQRLVTTGFLVELLTEADLNNLAADCLDGLLALIPGLKVKIARYPVTNAQYRRFVEGDGYRNQKWWSKEGWQWRQGKRDRPDYWEDKKWNGPACPVVGVTWYEAEAYCNWLSEYTGRTFRLPTEAEWQRAAQGGDNRDYPWGNEWAAGRCNTNEAKIGHTTPVGQFSPDGDSPLGCADMSGNVWEWCVPEEKIEQMFRVVRGGSWDNDRDDARCVSRLRNRAINGNNIIGFRGVSPILS